MRRVIRKHLRDFLAIALLAAIGLGTGAYILDQQGQRVPLLSEAPFEFEAAFTEAGGVKPGQNQAVSIAGVRIGEIADVELEDGRAILTLAVERRYAGRIRRDAKALLRPRTGLEDMFVDLDPGTEEAPPIEEGHRVTIGDTLPDVDSEEILNALDGQTQDYLRLLINGGADGLRNRDTDLRNLLKRLEPLHRDIARVNGALARQRAKLRRLVHNYGSLTTELGREDEELTRLVDASNAVFESFASRDLDISATVRKLPSALRQTETTLGKVDAFSDQLGPALESLRPAFRRLPEANAALLDLARSTTPTIRRDIRPFVRELGPYLEDLRPGARDLSRAVPDLEESFNELNRFFNMAAFNPGGAEPVTGNAATDSARDEGYLFWAGWLAHTSNNLFSTSDAQGPFRRSNFSASCPTLRSLVNAEPATELILNATNLLADAGLCPQEGGG